MVRIEGIDRQTLDAPSNLLRVPIHLSIAYHTTLTRKNTRSKGLDPRGSRDIPRVVPCDSELVVWGRVREVVQV